MQEIKILNIHRSTDGKHNFIEFSKSDKKQYLLKECNFIQRYGSELIQAFEKLV